MYTIKFWQETGWAVLVAIIVAAAQLAAEWDASALNDIDTWLVAGAGAIVRAAGAAILMAFGRGAVEN